MSVIVPKFTRTKICKAGDVLIDPEAAVEERAEALSIINHWRACHVYPMNTFQATLRKRLKKICESSFVAQRLKRVPSIVLKLERNKGMQLARMQDIGGLRAVVKSIEDVRKLEEIYRDGSLDHPLIGVDDYITNPKSSGYRSLHLIYRYENPVKTAYNGLLIELQIRTNLQHAWATAVETIGSFLNQALKSNEGSAEWLDFFKVVGAAFALIENSPIAEEFQKFSPAEIYDKCLQQEKKLDVRRKLQSFAVAANAITSEKNGGSYHLIVLDANDRTVMISSYGKRRLDEANKDYAKAENLALENTDMQVVLVATDSIESLRRAYPNYFLDTKQFVLALNRIDRLVKQDSAQNKLAQKLLF